MNMGPFNAYLQDIAVVLRDLINTIKRPIWHNPAKGSIVVTNPTAADLNVTAAAITIAAAQTVATITTLSQLAGFDVKQTVMYDTMRTAWGQNVRRLIT
jgi:hypothetical protein